jgi:pilus assembly protein Flp/PilA
MVDESGQGLVEYGLIIGLVAIVLVGVLGTLTGALQHIFTNISSTLNPGA